MPLRGSSYIRLGKTPSYELDENDLYAEVQVLPYDHCHLSKKKQTFILLDNTYALQYYVGKHYHNFRVIVSAYSPVLSIFFFLVQKLLAITISDRVSGMQVQLGRHLIERQSWLFTGICILLMFVGWQGF